MANGKTHLLIGATVGIAVALADKDKHHISHHPITGISLGAFFGKLPDVLEPSIRNPCHRQFCHSLLVLGSIGYGIKQLYEWCPEDGLQKFFRGVTLIAGCAYASHLISDAMTPRSLPLVGKL